MFFLLLTSFYSKGQKQWNVSLIADSLKKEANAVIRFFSTDYERTALERYTKTVHYAVTVLNENGKSAADLQVYYDRNSEVNSIELSIFDKDGQCVKTIKRKEVNDYAYPGSHTLFSDSRIKHYSPSYNYYPYTVEYSYTTNHRSVVAYPNWHPSNWFDIAVEKAQLSFQTPNEFELNYRELNGNFTFASEKTETTTSYRWELTNLKASKYAPYAPSYLDLLPTIMLAPTQIAYEGYTGNISNWENLGKWVHTLMQNRDELSPETLVKINQLTDTIPSKREKIKALYTYMQNRTRYVNIALGIGGFQPIPATEVDSKGYGDCKALSNYMRALLKGVGIDSYYTVIGNGRHQKIKHPDFTSLNQTNHIILCVPTEKDTIWLECTNQKFPFNYIGSSNADRYGLLITETGGILTKTPTYDLNSNYRSSVINMRLQETREADFEAHSTFNIFLYESAFPLLNMSKEEQKRALLKSLSVNGLKIGDFSITNTTKEKPTAQLYTKGALSSFAIRTGNRIFIEPTFLYENTFVSGIKSDRSYPIEEPIGYTFHDTLNITVPTNYDVEFLPENLELKSIYGIYKLVYATPEDDKISITRTVQIKAGTYGKSLFDEINHFLKNSSTKEKEKIILKKNQS